MLKIKFAFLGLMLAFLAVKAEDANLQIINLSPDTSMNLVEVSLEGVVLIDSLEFNEATAYLLVPEGLNQTLTFKSVKYPTEVFELTNLNFSPTNYYQSILFGVTNTVDYFPNPEGNPLDLNATFNMIDTLNVPAEKIAVNFFHAVSDAVELDVADFILEFIVNDMSFGNYSNTTTYFPKEERSLFFTSTDSVITVASRTVDLTAIEGKSITILLSGFIVSEDNNDGPDFGLYSVDEAGNVTLLDVISGLLLNELIADVKLFPNPARNTTQLQFNNLHLNQFNVSLIDLSGRNLNSQLHNAVNGFNQITVQLPEVSAGMYFILLESEGNSQLLPLIIAQ
jgi:hypothetical protein